MRALRVVNFKTGWKTAKNSSTVVENTMKNGCRVTKEVETKYYTLVDVVGVLSS
jgi:hypothetical protein